MTPREEYEVAEARVDELLALVDALHAGTWTPKPGELDKTFMDLNAASKEANRTFRIMSGLPDVLNNRAA